MQSKSSKLNNGQISISAAYIENHEIEDALQSMNIEILFPIQRRYYPGTNIVDGQLPLNMQSLPYKIKFRKEYYRVIHNGQIKVCSLCYSQDHLFTVCPKFVCFRWKNKDTTLEHVGWKSVTIVLNGETSFRAGLVNTIQEMTFLWKRWIRRTVHSITRHKRGNRNQVWK